MKLDKTDIALKGMREDLRWSGHPEYADRIENLERDPEGFWRTVPGTLQVGTWEETNADGIILAVAWFNPRPNQRWLVVEQATGQNTSTLKYLRWPDGVPVTLIERRRIPGRPRSQFLQVGRWLYHFNGLEAPIRWDGGNLASVGFAGPAPALRATGESEGFDFVDLASATIDAGVDANVYEQQGVGERVNGTEEARWAYAYGATVLNDLGAESPMSPLCIAHGTNEASGGYTNDYVAGIGTVDAGRRSVRLKSPRQYRNVFGVRFWRSGNIDGVVAGGNPRMYLLAEWELASEFDYVDMAGDEALGVEWDATSTGPVPAGVRAAEHWDGRLWLAVDGRVHYSAGRSLESFPALNYRDIGGASGGMVVALAVVPAGLVVLKERGVYIIKAGADYVVQTLTELVGCAAPRSVVYVPGLGLVWLSERGPQVLTGYLEADASTAVQALPGIERTWREQVGRSTLTNAWAVYREDVREVWFHVPTLGQLEPELGLVLHLPDVGWSLRPGWRFSSACYFRGRLWLGCSVDGDSATTGVYVLTRGDRSAGDGVGENADPSIPTGSYDPTGELPLAQPAPGAWAGDIPGTGQVEGLYQTGLVRWEPPRAVVKVGLLVVGTGQDAEVELWQRLGQEEMFRPGSGDAAIGTRTPAFKRDVWGEGLWSDSAAWGELEPVMVERSVDGRATNEWQGRLRGVDLRVGALVLHTARPTNPSREEG